MSLTSQENIADALRRIAGAANVFTVSDVRSLYRDLPNTSTDVSEEDRCSVPPARLNMQSMQWLFIQTQQWGLSDFTRLSVNMGDLHAAESLEAGWHALLIRPAIRASADRMSEHMRGLLPQGSALPGLLIATLALDLLWKMQHPYATELEDVTLLSAECGKNRHSRCVSLRTLQSGNKVPQWETRPLTAYQRPMCLVPYWNPAQVS